MGWGDAEEGPREKSCGGYECTFQRVPLQRWGEMKGRANLERVDVIRDFVRDLFGARAARPWREHWRRLLPWTQPPIHFRVYWKTRQLFPLNFSAKPLQGFPHSGWVLSLSTLFYSISCTAGSVPRTSGTWTGTHKTRLAAGRRHGSRRIRQASPPFAPSLIIN